METQCVGSEFFTVSIQIKVSTLKYKNKKHTNIQKVLYSLVIRLSSNAIDQPFVGDNCMAVDLQGKLFGLAPPHLSEECDNCKQLNSLSVILFP